MVRAILINIIYLFIRVIDVQLHMEYDSRICGTGEYRVCSVNKIFITFMR